MATTLDYTTNMGWLAWLVFVAAVACVGGIFVFAGLAIEKYFEKHGYHDVGDMRRSKNLREFGWWMLMLGIFLEIICTGSFAIRGEIEVRELRNSNPINLKVTDISAIAVIHVAGKRDPIISSDAELNSWAELLETNNNSKTLDLGRFGGLTASNLRMFNHYEGFPGQTNNGPAHHGFTMEFHANPLESFGETNFEARHLSAITPKNILERISAARIYLSFIPKEAEVLGGSVDLVINGTFNKHLVIPCQKTDKDMSNWNPNLSGIFLCATNSVP